jgi:hypothetical protein
MNESNFWDNFDEKLYKEYLRKKDAWRKRKSFLSKLQELISAKFDLN